MNIINTAAYQFSPLTDLPELRQRLLEICRSLALKGTILLGEEGINIMLAGLPAAISEIKQYFANELNLKGLTYKDSNSENQPFKRMLVKIKKEIISMGKPEIQPAISPAPNITAQELRLWLQEGRDFVLLDTRNDYEVKAGTFKQAIHLNVKHFRHFPDALKQLPLETKNKPVVTFCTGGIRCEKAAPYMQQQGFKEVYQLEGGILQYFAECGGDHYQGDCFVFDERTLLNPELLPVANGDKDAGVK